MVALPLSTTSPVVAAIYDYYAARPDGERSYLGVSGIGAECERQLWYGFRWAYPLEHHEGRMRRLFQTGHREEARVIADLEAIGVIFRGSPDGYQHAVRGVGGHFRGHLDGMIASGLPGAPQSRHVLEVKTHNIKSFAALLRSGVAIAKPMHMTQMQGYMHLSRYERAVYIAVEKDTDSLHVERVQYDPTEGARIVAKAERIISAPTPPPKLHEDPSAKMAFGCRWCPALAGCHQRAWARRNCRTCLHASPVLAGEDGAWQCDRFNRHLSLDDQCSGCGAHLYIPGLVPGRQVDASPETETVTYHLAAGGTWTDGDGRAA